MTGSATVSLTVEDDVAHLRLVRGAGNALDAETAAALDEALLRVEHGGGVRALLISGAGRSFSVGGDVGHLGRHLDRLPAEIDTLTAVWNGSILPRLAALPVPVVTAAQGIVGGAALGLLWCADVVVAAEDLHLVSGFSRLGLPGDGGCTWHLPRMVGDLRARQFLMRGTPWDAAESLDRGLVTCVVPTAELLKCAEREARALAAGPTWAYGELKRLLAASATASHDEQLAAERRAMVASASRPDARRGIEAALDRRHPMFDGA